MSVMMSVMSLGNIVSPIMAAGKAASAASSFFAIIDAPRINQWGLKELDVSAEEDITFEDVTFAYPSRPHVKVIDNLNVCFEKGKLTAIVGPSGSGKSTIVGLIERWYEIPQEGTTKIDEDDEKKGISEDDKIAIPLSGEIKVGEHSLRDLDLRWWRSQIGLVQQEPFLFNDTIFKNVSYGLIGSRFENEPLETKRALVEEACREAFADEFINKLPLVCLCKGLMIFISLYWSPIHLCQNFDFKILI
jgi:ATP-binding cassette, subfamily B (MDR/TAP), member 1